MPPEYLNRGGLSARSSNPQPPAPSTRRTEFGGNWWARQWIEALEAFGWDDRLQRGRSYARSGHVRSIDVQPGKVDARVKGSRPRPYVVKIELPPLADEAWERVADALAGQARYAAALLAGEMPPTIEQAFAAAGAHLFPQPDEPLTTDCSCPDWANPCKHVAAVHYVLGSEFDRDPFLLFRLRGRSKDEFIAMLRARRTVARDDNVADEPAVVGSAAAEQADPPLAAVLDRFWTLGDDFGDLRFAIERPRVPEAVLKRLGSPVAGPESDRPLTELARLYAAISEQAIRSAYEDEG